MRTLYSLFAAVALLMLLLGYHKTAAAEEQPADGVVATFAGGCFWCMESPFRSLPGVISVRSGYTGGSPESAHYDLVSSGQTQHREAVQVIYDPRQVHYRQLLATFWQQIDPTDDGGQFADRGRHYQAMIYTHNDHQRRWAEASKRALAASKRFAQPITTPIVSATPFYPAEATHQAYAQRHPAAYQRYYRASGRAAFINNNWQEPPPAIIDLSPWQDFRKPTPAELRQRLSPEAFRITQADGTETRGSDPLAGRNPPGIYVDIVSGEPLFSSHHRYPSTSGWPSFSQALEPGLMSEHADHRYGMQRIEVRSRHADSHLGHLFFDGPEPSGLRYCINAAAMRLIPADELTGPYAQYRFLFSEHTAAE